MNNDENAQLPVAAPRTEIQATRASLLSRVRSWSDQESWNEFYQAYSGMVFSLALKMGLSKPEAEDVVQETFISVAGQMSEFRYDREKGSFRSWLCKITQRRIIDHLRKKRPETVDTPFSDPSTSTPYIESLPATASSDLAFDDADWEKGILLRAEERTRKLVNPRFFQVYDLLVHKSWSVERVSREFGITQAYVYLQKFRVIQKIKDQLKRIRKELGE